jgi:hypothetical protein
MHPVLRPAVLVVVAAALAACATTSTPERRSMQDPGADFGSYRSFAWRQALAEGADDAPLRMLDVNIRNAVTAELVKRGYAEDAAAPQFYVAYETAMTDKVKSSPVRFGIGMGSWGGNVGGSVSMGTPSVQNYQEGELIVRAIDAGRNTEVWYGTVSGEVDRSKLDADAVARAVAVAMQDFPTRPGVVPVAPGAPAAP